MHRSRLGRMWILMLTCVLAVPTVIKILHPDTPMGSIEEMRPYILTGGALGALHILLRPILRIITAPLGCLTLGLAGTAIDIGLIYLADYFVKDFRVPGFLCAALIALVINGANLVTGARK